MRRTLLLAIVAVSVLPACGSGGHRKKRPASLTFSVGAQNPAARGIASGAQDLPVLQLHHAAGVKDGVRIQDLVVRASGTGNDAIDIAAVELWLDADSDGAPGGGDSLVAGPLTFGTDDGSLTFSPSSLVIPKGTAVDLLVVYDLEGIAVQGTTFEAAVLISEISATGASRGKPASKVGDPFVQGGPFTVCQLILSLGSADAAIPSTTTIAPGDRTRAMTQFSFTATDIDGDVTSVTIKADGTGWDDQDLTNVEIFWDANADGALDPGDAPIGNGPLYVQDNGESVVPVLDPLVPGPLMIPMGSTLSFLIVYDFKNPLPSGNGTTFQASVTDGTKVTTASGLYVFGSAFGKEISVFN